MIRRMGTRQALFVMLAALTVSLAVGVFAGCGGSGTATTSAPATTSASTAAKTSSTTATPTSQSAQGGQLTYGANTLSYAAPVSSELASKLFDYLITTFSWTKTSSTGMNFAIAKIGSVYQLAMVTKKGQETDKDVLASAKLLAQDSSKKVFGGAEVDVYLTDSTWSPLAVVKP